MKTNQNNSDVPDDEKLDALLGKWKGITPAPGFNETVWRRLSVTAPQKKHSGRIFTWFRDNVKPLDVFAALGGMAAGLLLSLQISNHDGAQVDSRFQILKSSSLTRGYVQLASQQIK
ncbi:MAG: hypothetical protein WCI03_02770 [bacterium]